MINIIIVALLAVIIFVAVKVSAKHLRGEGSCCTGGGSSVIREHKKLDDPVIAKKTVKIGGMSCENCAARVEHAVNKIEGAACEVNLNANTAEISLSRKIPDEELKAAIEKAGYEVKSFEGSN
ncbi:cation transporter [Treponema parvum]|uniref:Cation transporter n=1 Tax=Treponema parvum TaxID=138851 RepID=A0A975IF29_9SPIR|nr:heavy metal-associated domain-containing protein [Treponema parvum]QTQ14442.1 cation transporter [Treponema parvum]